MPSSELAYSAAVWRFVEDQGPSATMRITDTLAEQARLEALLDQTKPELPPPCAGYDFLISTPFRYRPYPEGSRFRRAGQIDGVFYGSESVETALAEFSFYRALFFAQAPDAKRPTTPQPVTAFMVHVAATTAVDLTRAPYRDKAAVWADPLDYGPCQDLADDARRQGAAVIRYPSVRCPRQGLNVAVLDIRAITDTLPQQRRTWHLLVRGDRVQARCECPPVQAEFLIDDWARIDQRLAPSLDARTAGTDRRMPCG